MLIRKHKKVTGASKDWYDVQLRKNYGQDKLFNNLRNFYLPCSRKN